MSVYIGYVRVVMHILHPASQASSTKDNRSAIAIDDLLSLNPQNTIGHFGTLVDDLSPRNQELVDEEG
jgi:hypothetical protein